MTINHKKIEKILKEMDISWVQGIKRNWKVECTKFPVMVEIFNNMVEEQNGIVPQIEDFGKAVFSLIEDKIEKEFRLAAKGRITRAFLSFAREYHLFLLLKDSISGVQFYRTTKLDIMSKVDVLAIYKKKNYKIHAFQSTYTAKLWRKKKEKRKIMKPIEGKDIELVLGKDKIIVGDWWLYGPKHVEIVQKEIGL